ncbi:MAG: SMP-30/gluconolactonase/LRE family protein, partial [Actinomycetota bacterium]
MTDYVARTIHSGLSFGEGPRWHEGRLWFSDFYRHAVYSIAADGSDERVELDVRTQPSGLGWLPDGSLLVVSMTDQKVLRYTDGTVSVHADISPHCGFWANDMVVSSDGTAYVGNFGVDVDTAMRFDGPAGLMKLPSLTTNLVVISPDGHVIQVVPDMSFPNGSVISPDGQTLIIGETMAFRLSAFDIATDGT